MQNFQNVQIFVQDLHGSTAKKYSFCFSLIFISPGVVSNCKETFFIYFIVFISIVCCKWCHRHNSWRHWEVSTPAAFTVWLNTVKSTMNTNWSYFLSRIENWNLFHVVQIIAPLNVIHQLIKLPAQLLFDSVVNYIL